MIKWDRKPKLLGSTILSLVLVLAAGFASAGQTLPPQEIPPFVEGQVLIKVESGVSLPEVAQAVGARVDRSIGDGTIHVLLMEDLSATMAAEILMAVPGVVFAEPNWLRQLHEYYPNDDGYDLKWDLNNDGSLCDGTNCATADADMHWQEAYTLLGSCFDRSATVAVVDTGIDLNHPDLDAKITANRWDFLDGDADPSDTHGHGTHVAGIALAETNNGDEATEPAGEGDTAGVGHSSNIEVMPLRVCDQYGCPTSAIVNAIYYAADNGAKVVNLSLGGKVPSSSEEQAINYAWNQGLVIVCSSGNDGAGKVSYPAAFANCIAVGSTDWHDQLWSDSNRGNDLDVVAPGGDMDHYDDPGGIWSTMPTYDVYLTTAYAYDKYYDHLQGTSMAAPQVSGLAGLLFALGVTDADEDGNTNDEIRNIIESTVDDLGSSGWDRSYGWGRINVYNAILAAHGGRPFEDIAITAMDAPSSVGKGEVVDVSVMVDNVRNVSVTVDLTVTVTDYTDSTTVGSQTISGGLAACASTTPTFTWDTGGATLGDHMLTASHDFADYDTTNNSKSITVTVSQPTAIGLTSLSAALEDRHVLVWPLVLLGLGIGTLVLWARRDRAV
ncbi:MAG: S8 family serine peptidase [Anaerolineae bacterium]|nr:S8 family serine peptidase [Anaerolineae bacterium]NIN98934.1 S8 family serine peptidase [Anaerolineae bacterium]